ncbi:MAG: SemiSWEET transporter [Burkholderiales bacterium]|nr:SemiSWEET transporter [Burkholderiales bacterium]
MTTLSADLIGYFAACLTTSAFIPQAWLTWRRKRAEGVSLGMYVILVSGVALWLTYGILLHAWPVIIANLVTLMLALFILWMRLVYK